MNNPASLTADKMRSALTALATKIAERKMDKVSLILGGGGAMVLAHGFPLATTDLDAVPRGMEFSKLDVLVKEIAEELDLPKDWLNPYFSTFSHTLPADYAKRLVRVFECPSLEVDSLGKEEMLIMKCFAHRRKDLPHARALVRGGVDVEFVEARIDELVEKKIPHAEAAIDFLQEVLELEGR